MDAFDSLAEADSQPHERENTKARTIDFQEGFACAEIKEEA